MQNPSVPPGFELLGLAIPVVAVILTVTALVTLVKSDSVTQGQRVGWAVGIVLVPGVIAVLWLVLLMIERRMARAQRSDS